MSHRTPWSLSDGFLVDNLILHTYTQTAHKHRLHTYTHNYIVNITHATNTHTLHSECLTHTHTHTHTHTQSQQFLHKSQSHISKLSSHTQRETQTRPVPTVTHLMSQQFLQSRSLNLSPQTSSMTKPDQTRPTYTTDLRSSPRPGSSSKRSVMHSQSFIISLMSHKLSTRYAACSWSWRNTG